MPIIFDFEQVSAEIHFERNKLWIGADYCFEESCKRFTTANQNRNNVSGRVGQSSDMDVNYYDISEK